MQVKINAVLFEIPHIKLVSLETEEYCLIVEDTKLNDYVEDFLLKDYDYQSIFVSVEGSKTPVVYHNYYNANILAEGLVDALRTLDVVEVERIFRLNN